MLIFEGKAKRNDLHKKQDRFVPKASVPQEIKDEI